MKIREGLTFDDVLLVPQHSTIKSRATDVDISVKWGSLKFSHPVIPANMKTVTGVEMASAIIESGGLTILHRFMPFELQLEIAEDLVDHYGPKNFAMSIGVKENDKEYVKRFLDVGVRMLCVDIAHGDSQQCLEMISWIKTLDPRPLVIAGNIATGEAARRLWEAGASVVKVGIGPGSLCTTRLETGNGVPQLTALMDVAEAQQQMIGLYRTKDKKDYPDGITKRHFPIISDGGIKNAGDIVKALCFADMVMAGNLFAGTDESPGTVFERDGKFYKNYDGSSTHKTNHIEGVRAMVPFKGPVEEVLTKLLEGLRSGCSYQGAHNLEELKDNPTFIRITNAGLKESHPHDVIVR